MPRGPDRQLPELRATSDGQSAERPLPRQVEQARRRRRGGGAAGTTRRRPASAGSELLAQVRGDRRVVAERLVQVAGVRPVVAGGDLDEGGAELGARSARPRPSAARPTPRSRAPGVHDEGQDPDDRSSCSKRGSAWTAMNPRIAPSCSATMTAPCGGREPLEALGDVDGAGGIALVGEERGDRLGVVGGGRAEGRWRRCRSWRDGTRLGQHDEAVRTGGPARRAAGPRDRTDRDAGTDRRTVAGVGRRRRPRVTARSQTAAGPSPWRASVAASRPSVEGSSRTTAGTPAMPGRSGATSAPRSVVHAPVDRRGPTAPGRPSRRPRSTRSSSTVAQPTAIAGGSARTSRASPRARDATRRRRSAAPCAHPTAAGPGTGRRPGTNPTSRVDPSRDVVVVEDAEVRPVAAGADRVGVAAAVTARPRPRPRAHVAVPIDER